MIRTHYFNLGYSSCLFQHNFWITSCPYEGWRADAWKDGNFQAQRELSARRNSL